LARVIAVIGSKGGSGKTTCAHLIAHGCGSLPRPVPAVVLTTDPEERPRTDRRRYLVADARSRTDLLAQMARLLPVEPLLVVLDGAAARADLDQLVSEVADIAILPFRPAAHDAERARDNLARLPRAWALPMGWPRHPGTAKRARRWLAGFPPERLLPPFPHLPRLDGFLSEEGYLSAAYDVASPARGLALEVLARAGIDPDELSGPSRTAQPAA
jgi:chromosome partitioning protein